MARSRLRVVKPEGRRAAVYLRKSTDEQAESLPQQREACRQYAAKYGYGLVSEFCDAGISGVNSGDTRPEFVRLVSAAEAGQFDFVIAWDL